MKHMSYERRRRKRTNPLLIPLAVLCVVVVVLLVILLVPDKEAQQPDQSGQTQGSQGQDSQEQSTGQSGNGTVETPYGTLYYSEEWKDSIRAECKELDFGMDVLFYGSIAGEEYWLYTVSFGGSAETPAGVIETDQGYMMDVTYELSDFAPDDSWTAENKDAFCAMQESINYLLEKLQENPAFTK